MATAAATSKQRPSHLAQPEAPARLQLSPALSLRRLAKPPRTSHAQPQTQLSGHVPLPSSTGAPSPQLLLVRLPNVAGARPPGTAGPRRIATDCSTGSGSGLVAAGDAVPTPAASSSGVPDGVSAPFGVGAAENGNGADASALHRQQEQLHGLGTTSSSSSSSSGGGGGSGGDHALAQDNGSASGTGASLPPPAAAAPSGAPSPASPSPTPQLPPSIQFALSTLRQAAKKLRPLVETVLLLCLWYASNIFYNIYNKQVLQVFPYATTCTCLHLVVAIVLLSSLWIFKIKRVPHITERTLATIFPLGVLHLLGFLTTNMSLGAVNVSLTHTIKSLEPFFTVLLSLFFFGSLPALPVLVTLVPIVMGVVVASATDLSFNWYGFSTAMGSNLAFQSRNVLSKKYMVESSLESLEGSLNPNEVLDEVDLFLCISVLALPMAMLAGVAMEGEALTSRFLAASGDVGARAAAVMSADVLTKNVLAGACRTADVFASYGLLSRLSPVTHSVANCVKRVVVISVSILFFKTHSSYLNIVGTVMALGGVFAYSMAERMTPKQKKQTLPGQAPRSMSSRMGTWLQALALSMVPAQLLAAWRQREERLLEAALLAQEAEAEAKARAQAEREAKDKEEGTQPDYFL